MSSKIKYRSDLHVSLLDYMGDDFTVARAARVSTGDEYIEEDRLAGLINYLVREDHGSTLEHNVVSFRFEAPLPVLGQFVRHRHISPNVQSGRYSEYLPQFYMPPKRRPLENAGKSSAPILIPGSKSQRKIMKNARKTAAETTMSLYQEQLDAGIANEVARDVLSQHLYTSWWGTANLRAWLHFLKLRNGKHGHPQWEIAQLADQIEWQLNNLYPVTMDAWRKHCQ